jgi:hypothetical protein
MNQLKFSGVEVEVSLENMPIALKAYACQLLIVAIGFIVTNLRHSISVYYDAPNYEYDPDVCDEQNPAHIHAGCKKQALLVKFFGYNNVCYYFDSAPANYILPPIYAATMCWFLLYLFLEWTSYKLTNKAKLLSNCHYNLLTRMKWFEAFAFIFFSTIFAVSPENETTMRIHSVPFVVFELGLVSMVFSNFFHGKWSNCYEEEFGSDHHYIRWRWRYAIAFTIILLCKIPFQIYSLVYMPGTETGPLNSSPLKGQPGVLLFLRAIDYLFFGFAAILPLFFGVWYLRAKAHKNGEAYFTKITFEPVWKARGGSSSSIKSVAREVSSILMGLPKFHGKKMSEEDQHRAYEIFKRLDRNGTGCISTTDIERFAGQRRRVSMAYYAQEEKEVKFAESSGQLFDKEKWLEYFVHIYQARGKVSGLPLGVN